MLEDGPVWNPSPVATQRMALGVSSPHRSRAAKWSHRVPKGMLGPQARDLRVITERQELHDHSGSCLPWVRARLGCPTHHLPVGLNADDSGDGRRDAGLRPERRRALGRLRRVLGGRPRHRVSRTQTLRSSSPPTAAIGAASRPHSARNRRCGRCRRVEAEAHRLLQGHYAAKPAWQGRSAAKDSMAVTTDRAR